MKRTFVKLSIIVKHIDHHSAPLQHPMKKITSYLLFLALSMISNALLAQQKVTVQPFKQLAQSRQFELPATVVNLHIAEVAAESNGRIIHFPLLVGDEVKKGQDLIKLDCTQAEIDQNRAKAALKRLQASRQLTEQQLQRAQGLVQSRSISRDELDQRQTQLAADNASIEEQQAMLRSTQKAVQDCTLKAPFSGTIINKHASVGSYASPGAPVLSLLKKQAVEIELNVPASLKPDLQAANDLIFEHNAKTYPLSLRKFLPRMNTATLQQPVRLQFNNRDHPPGGSYGTVTFSTPSVYIPARVIQKRAGQFGVFILQQQQANFHPLSSAQEGQSVRSELPADSLIITSPLQQLSHGESVDIE